MVSGFISRLVILIFGTLYPAYASYKAVRTKNVKEYVKWMMYWIVFALFTCAETFTDLFLSFWFPFYYEIKIITVIYLLSPATKGSSILYRKFVHPVLTKREQEIDEYIAKAKEQGYHTMLNLGSRGVNYATSLIMQTAIKGLPNLPLTPSSDFLPGKNPDAIDPFDLEDDCYSLNGLSESSMGQGGGGLVNQLRKSYSLSDLREEENESVIDGGGSRLIRRNQAQNSGQILPENHGGFYSPVANCYQNPVDMNREMFFDDINSGYPNGDPMHFNRRTAKEDVFVRTASLGPSSRIRTRAATKNGLPKRASLSEGGSTESALEPHESQNETDKFTSALSHSASYPSPLTSFPPYFAPEYQQMFNNVILNQMFAFVTHPQSFSQVLDNRTGAHQNAFGVGLECQNDGAFGNHPVCVSEENLDNASEGHSKDDDASDAAGEVPIGNNENTTENHAYLKNEEMGEKLREAKSTEEEEKNKEKEKKHTETKNMEEKETTKGDLFFPLSDNLEGQEKQFQKRCGKYKKKPAPTPPTERTDSKPTSNLTVEDEDSEFFTPDASPKPSRKQSVSCLDILQTGESKSKTQTSTTAEVAKKCKTKKGGDISKKLIIPRMSFSFWHQKSGKHSSNSDSCSVASVESTSTRPETQSDTEFFIPLRDEVENEDEESIGKDDPPMFGVGHNQ